MRITGKYERLGEIEHFIPYALPPNNPNLELSVELLDLYGAANFALGKLNQLDQKIPQSERIIKAM